MLVLRPGSKEFPLVIELGRQESGVLLNFASERYRIFACVTERNLPRMNSNRDA